MYFSNKITFGRSQGSKRMEQHRELFMQAGIPYNWLA
jgi:hypothetical protein